MFHKIFFKTIFLLLFLSLATLNTFCKRSLTKKITYEGTVYDTDTINKRKPVDGAIIELFACSTSQEKASYYCSGNQIFIGKATSDASGHFKIKEKAANSGAYFIYLNGKPYNHARISVQDLSGYYSNIYTIFVK